MKRTGYPLAAVCGMEKAKEAVTLALVNPHAGGVLVSGEKGTGKSTLMRGARELYNAPWIEIPVSVTEDRLFGSIDAEAAVKYGKRQLQPGLIDEANGGVVYLDDAKDPSYVQAYSFEEQHYAVNFDTAAGGPGTTAHQGYEYQQVIGHEAPVQVVRYGKSGCRGRTYCLENALPDCPLNTQRRILEFE